MAFADPITVTISAVANVLARVGQGVNQGLFRKDDGNVSLTISHAYNKRVRRSIRIDYQKIAADPLISAQSILYRMGVQLIFDEPITGFTVAERKAIFDGFSTYLNASSGAAITKLLGGES